MAGRDCCPPTAAGVVLASVALPDPGPAQCWGQPGAQPREDRGGSRSERRCSRSGHATAPVPPLSLSRRLRPLPARTFPRLRPPVRGARHRLGVRLRQACQHRSGGAQSAGPRARDRGPRPACTPLALPARSGRGASRWRFVLAGCHPLTRVLAAALSRGATVIGVVGRPALRAICHELKLHADRFTQ